ncbi:MAG TPA: hypothetical protein VH092_09140 [Urbifossiella sp.]|nr:hypothetical protein [Urbifossiella sp.]
MKTAFLVLVTAALAAPTARADVRRPVPPPPPPPPPAGLGIEAGPIVAGGAAACGAIGLGVWLLRRRPCAVTVP